MPRPFPVSCRLPVFVLCFLVGATLFAAETPATVESVRTSANEWAKIRAETSRLESNWEWERGLLGSTLKALEEHAQELENTKKTLTARTAADRGSLTGLSEKNAASDRAIKAAQRHLERLSADLVALRPWLPPRLSQALELPYRSLANPDLSPGERMQLVTTVLNRSAQFNKTITFGDEVLPLRDTPETKMLEVLYWGLSHAYALDRAAGKAYLGSPGEKGWSWEARPDLVDAVGRLIAIYQDQADPKFIETPARFRDVIAGVPAATTP